jgi:hypothetical protein
MQVVVQCGELLFCSCYGGVSCTSGVGFGSRPHRVRDHCLRLMYCASLYRDPAAGGGAQQRVRQPADPSNRPRRCVLLFVAVDESAVCFSGKEQLLSVKLRFRPCYVSEVGLRFTFVVTFTSRLPPLMFGVFQARNMRQ